MTNKKGNADIIPSKTNLNSNSKENKPNSQPIKVRKRKYRRKFNLNRIRSKYSYTIQEACKLLRISRSTFFNWKRQGLEVNGNLIFGKDLKEFLKKKQEKMKFERKCRENECPCVRCKKPVIPWENAVDIVIFNEKLGMIKGLCPVCQGRINRIFFVPKLEEIKKLFHVQMMADKRLIDYGLPNGNCILINNGKKHE